MWVFFAHPATTWKITSLHRDFNSGLWNYHICMLVPLGDGDFSSYSAIEWPKNTQLLPQTLFVSALESTRGLRCARVACGCGSQGARTCGADMGQQHKKIVGPMVRPLKIPAVGVGSLYFLWSWSVCGWQIDAFRIRGGAGRIFGTHRSGRVR